VAADVDARAGIAVVPPRTARSTVLLDDRERQAGLRKPYAGEQARFAATDDDGLRVLTHGLGDLVAPRDGPGVAAVEVQILEEHRHGVRGHFGAREERHHLAYEFG
jgi:hypothetical protein